MFKRRKEIHKEILQPEQDNPTDISYRGQGLSNEYRLPLASGLIGWFEKRYVEKILNTPQDKI